VKQIVIYTEVKSLSQNVYRAVLWDMVVSVNTFCYLL